MRDVVQELVIAAAPERVFRALTRPDELVRWWANRASAEARVGAPVELRFDNGEVIRMAIDDLTPARSVRWVVWDAPRETYLVDWVGTRIGWELAPAAAGTALRLGHAGLSDAAYEPTRAGWAHFLASLRFHVETGHGTPFKGERPRTA